MKNGNAYRRNRISSRIQKILNVLFVCVLFAAMAPQKVNAEGEIIAHLGVMTWDGTTACGSVSLDGGEFGAGDGKDLDRTQISPHVVTARPAPGYEFRGWHISRSENGARKSGISSTEAEYHFQFGLNYVLPNAPYYLIAEFVPVGTEYDQYVDPETLNGTNWMSGISGDRLLSEINIPGTHDTMCRNVWCYHAFGSMYEYGALTQDLTLEQQLSAGVRLLDLRLTNETKGLNNYDENNLRLCHGSYKIFDLDLLYYCLNDEGYVITLQSVMSTVTRFLREHPSETIIITLKSEYDNKDSDGAVVLKRIKEILQDYDRYIYMEDRMPSLREVRGKAVVLANDKNGVMGNSMRFWQTGGGTVSVGNILMFYENTYNIKKEEKARTITDFYNVYIKDNDLPKNLSTHRSFSRIVYTSASTAPFDDSPADTAQVVNKLIYKGDDPLFSHKGKFYGWVYSDFVTNDSVSMLWKTNFPDDLQYRTITYKATVDGRELQKSETYLNGSVANVRPNEWLGDFTGNGWYCDGKLYPSGVGTIAVNKDLVMEAATEFTWSQLKALIDTTPEYGVLNVTLPSDVTAEADDETFVISKNKTVIIDLNGHTIDARADSATDRGVFLMDKGSLTLKNGTVTGGHAEKGGGIRIDDTTGSNTVALDNVTITGNSADTEGGGVFVGYSMLGNNSFSVAGNTIIQDNVNDDVYLRRGNISGILSDGPVINVTGELADTARIGVMTADEKYFDPTELTEPVIISRGLSGNGTAGNFFSDAGNVVSELDGEAVISNQLHIVTYVNYDPTKTGPSKDFSVYVKHNERAEEFKPGPEGYTAVFQGWYKDPEWTEEYNFNDPVTESMSLYARWQHYHWPMLVNNAQYQYLIEQFKLDDSHLVEDTAPTCTEPGRAHWYVICYNDYEYMDLTTEEVLPALGHDWSNWEDNGDGTETRTCRLCGETRTREIHDHNLEYVEEREAICPETGMKAHYVCSICGDLFIETDDGMAETTEKELRIQTHVFQKQALWQTEATCLQYGTELSVGICQNCGAWEAWDDSTGSYDRGYKFAQAYRKDHTWGEPVWLVKPTCTGEGLYYHICGVCGATENVYAEKLEHTYETEREVTPPTCTEPGLIVETERCTGCGRINRQTKTELPATGHDYDNGTVTKEPSCTENGERTYTCRNDHTHFYTEPIPALGHKAGEWEVKPIPESACTDTWTEIRIQRCIRCDEILERIETEQPPLGHDWEEPIYEWAEDNRTVSASAVCARSEKHTVQETATTTSEVTKEPTRTEDGERTYTAEFRDPVFKTQTKTEIIPRLDPETYVITFDLSGGTLNGQTGILRVEYSRGEVIRLPRPSRQGYTFDYWEGSRYEAGDPYTVTEAHTFTARWKKNGSGGGSENKPAPMVPDRRIIPNTYDPGLGRYSAGFSSLRSLRQQP